MRIRPDIANLLPPHSLHRITQANSLCARSPFPFSAVLAKGWECQKTFPNLLMLSKTKTFHYTNALHKPSKQK